MESRISISTDAGNEATRSSLLGSPEQSSDGLKKPVRYQRPNRFSTTYFRTTVF
ncbi:MAG: hypothetical protein KAH84_00675 [Thiomargarita sp.]|nr:hypothetical protein [Thiomargarita sp.]